MMRIMAFFSFSLLSTDKYGIVQIKFSLRRVKIMDDIREAGMDGILQPDPLAPYEFFESIRGSLFLQPEKRLMLALLEDAVRIFRKYVESPHNRMYQEAIDWIADTEGDSIFSFGNICVALGLNPDYIRRGLMKWIKEALTTKKRYKYKRRSRGPHLGRGGGGGGGFKGAPPRLFFYAKNNANLLIPLHDNFGLV